MKEQASQTNKIAADTPTSSRRPMKVLFCASECVPFVKTGGLADVAGSLPRALVQAGEDVRVILPKYRLIPYSYICSMEHVTDFTLLMGSQSVYCGIDTIVERGVRYYFVDNLALYSGDSIYTGHESEGYRFAFFCRAILEALPRIGFFPDIIHCNDWQTALVPIYYSLFYANNDWYQGIKTLFTIHNIQYQGKYGMELLSDVLGTDSDVVMRPIEADVDRKLLSDAVARLSPREKDIISLRFGLGGRKELTQKEVADRLGISQSYISRLEKRIILRLRREIVKMA